jgi:signal transduction histidine kinase
MQELSARDEPITRSLRLPDRGIGGTVYQLNAIPLKSADGYLSEVLYHVHDVTAEARMLDAMLHERRSRSALALVSHITHEVNNVLGGIGGIAQLLIAGDVTADEVSSYMAKVSELVSRGTKLISDLSDVSAEPTDRSVIAPAKLLRKIERTLTETLPAGIRLRITVAEEIPPVEVDLREIEVALTHLAMNAAEASLPGGTVVIEAEKAHLAPEEIPARAMTDELDFVRIAVIDSGRGIHSDERERVFAPFFTTKGMHKGLGLPLASLIFERHQGFLGLEKSDELGSTFAAYLPAASATGSPTATEDTGSGDSAKDSKAPKKTPGK